ncbi:MAG: alpha/beta hydrolase [Rhodobacterales bacterium]|nr:alpha/beta hydrolase [Rhodobacterales bacterium]
MPTLPIDRAQPLHYTDHGAGRPIVLVHGWAAHGGYFNVLVPHLEDRFRVVLPDMRGHGRSRMNGERPTLADMGDDLYALLGTLGRDDAVVVGWSMGTLVMFDCLRRHGAGRMGGIVIEDMTACILNGPDWHLGVRNNFSHADSDRIMATMRLNWASYAAAIAPRLYGRSTPPPPDLATWTVNELMDNEPEPLAAIWATLVDQDYRDLLPTLDLPALIIHGGDSHVYPVETGMAMAAMIPGAHRICYDAAGHSPHLEEPERFAADLAAFASR